ncbi:hypothetical protein ABZ135_21075 [Streptomyces sp. NPDC006339]|uniref:hypothetical protein n=1 Tax=Streptomyces sp. NPDC006339 TaxID=3156755 RepID=UPI0033BC4641
MDAEAVGDVLARVVAPLPGRVRARDRDRRLQRVFRTTVHHLDAGEVSPSLAALLAAVARALVPWHAYPNAPRAAAAPRYGDATEPPPTEAGEALLADPAELFTALMATSGRHAVPLTPPVEPWRAHHVGRFRRCTRPAPGVWAAETIRCPECGGKDGPWTVDCDWRRAALGCPCGAVHREHGLALSEIWLALAES